MASSAPPIHRWHAGDEMNAARMQEIKDAIDWLRNPPMVHVSRRNTNQNATANVWTDVSFDTTVNNYDPYNMWDISDPTKVYCTVAGWYTYEAVLCIGANSDDCRLILAVFLNGTSVVTDEIMKFDQQSAPSAGGNVNMRKEAQVFLNVGDHLRLNFNYNGATARQLIANSDAECPQLRVRWVSN